ncbi:unnamed protein product [Prorocentrum cordatum]|uniref:Uncharacterized protein n=1 Tax=Prorocentrum cordatum TaxID=2364126 RepID=A0ABN9U8L2_9DINO|nr:unnamed protein product [Polarella glacialis]
MEEIREEARAWWACQEYSRGGLPCRINHGTASNRISWDRTEEEVRSRREELLVLSADGLREIRHPYSTVARLAFADLAGLAGCPPLSEQALRSIVGSMRLALQVEQPSSARSAPSPKRGLGAPRDRGVFEGALAALLLLARSEGPGLVPFLHVVIPPIGKRLLLRGHREPTLDVLRELASVCGPGAEAVMRSRGVVL